MEPALAKKIMNRRRHLERPFCNCTNAKGLQAKKKIRLVLQELSRSAEPNTQLKHKTISLNMHTYSGAFEIIDTLLTSDFSKISNHAVQRFQNCVPKTPLSGLL